MQFSRAPLTLLFLAAIFVLPMHASAVTITPSSVDVDVLPGKIGEAEVTLYNDSGAERTYTLSFLLVEFDDLGGSPVFSSLPNEQAHWFSLPASTISLTADEHRTINVRVMPPSYAASQTLVVALVASESSTGEGVQISAGISSLIFVTIGDVERHVYLQGGSLAALSGVYSTLPKEFDFVFRNDGEGVLAPTGEVEVRNPFGKVVATAPLNRTGAHIFPGTERVLTVGLTGNLSPVFGPYRITIVPGPHVDVAAEDATAHIFIVSWIAVVIAAVLLAIVAGLMMRGWRRRRTV